MVDIDPGDCRNPSETDVIELTDGSLYAAMRTEGCYSVSHDSFSSCMPGLRFNFSASSAASVFKRKMNGREVTVADVIRGHHDLFVIPRRCQVVRLQPP
jgi:hypothetical protein